MILRCVFLEILERRQCCGSFLYLVENQERFAGFDFYIGSDFQSLENSGNRKVP